MPRAQLRDQLRDASGPGGALDIDAFDVASALRVPPSSRKIVFVNRFFYPDMSATSQMLSDLAMRLARTGADVHVICSRQLYENACAHLPERERIHGVNVHRVWTATFGRDSLRGRALDYASFYLMATAKLWRLLRAGDVAVVKTDPPLLSVSAAAVVAIRGAKLVNWLQDVFPEVASRLEIAHIPRWLESRLRTLRDWSLRMAKANVVLGERMSAYLETRGVSGESLRVVENWADGANVLPKPVSASRLRTDLQLQGRFVVAYSGNLGRAHEFETMLAAATALREDPAFVFLMVGGGAKMGELHSRVTELGLENFRFLPYQSREMLSDSLAAADVHLACLLPELEGLIVPSKMYGILAAGRPAVFIGDTDGELARLLEESHCGVSVRCGDGALLAEELRRMQRDNERTRLMGLRARAVFETRFTLNRAVRKWIHLLSDVGMPLSSRAPQLDMPANEPDVVVTAVPGIARAGL